MYAKYSSNFKEVELGCNRYLQGKPFPVKAAWVTMPEKASMARRPFFNSEILYFSKLAGLAPSFKGSKE